MRRLTLVTLALLAGCGSSTPHGTAGSGGHGDGGRGGAEVGGKGGAGGGAGGQGGNAGSTDGGAAGAAGGAAGAAGGKAGAAGAAGGKGGAGGAAGGKGGAGGAAGGKGGAAGAPDGGLVCAVPPGIPDGGVRCASSSPCAPRPDGGVCYGTPLTNAATTSFTIWIVDAAAPAGGWSVTLAGITPVTAGGHSYQYMQEGLIGTGGNGVFGDLYVARDGQAKWTGFHFEGFASYQGGGAWDWPATLTVSRAGAAAPATVGRHYAVTRTGSGCNSGTYTYAADDPPRACAFGIDLLAIVLPGG